MRRFHGERSPTSSVPLPKLLAQGRRLEKFSKPSSSRRKTKKTKSEELIAKKQLLLKITMRSRSPVFGYWPASSNYLTHLATFSFTLATKPICVFVYPLISNGHRIRMRSFGSKSISKSKSGNFGKEPVSFCRLEFGKSFSKLETTRTLFKKL